MAKEKVWKTFMIMNLLDSLQGYKKVYMNLMVTTSPNDLLEKYSSSILNSLEGIKKSLKDIDKLMNVRGKGGFDLGSLKFNIENRNSSKFKTGQNRTLKA